MNVTANCEVIGVLITKYTSRNDEEVGVFVQSINSATCKQYDEVSNGYKPHISLHGSPNE